ncbi:hypothetical protein OC834_002644 [Tilletia horrida]|nr:hypothetical protein OC834_002644 [Tilletia horrida]
MHSIAESPVPRSRSHTFSNDSDTFSLNSSTFPKRKKLNGIVQRSASGLQTLFRTLIPEHATDASQGQGSTGDLLYPQVDAAPERPERPRRKSDSADELLKSPNRLRKPRANPLGAAFEQAPRMSMDPTQKDFASSSAGPSRLDAGELRHRPSTSDRHVLPGARLPPHTAPKLPLPPPPSAPPASIAPSQSSTRKQTASKLGMLASECCTAASVHTPKNNPMATELHRDSFYGDTEWGKQHVDDINALLSAGYRPAADSGLGLSLSAEPTGLPFHSDFSPLPASLSMPAVRPPPVPKKSTPNKDGYQQGHSTAHQPRPELSSTSTPAGTHPFPYQALAKAGNSTLSLTTEHQNPSSTSLPRPEFPRAPTSGKGAGLAGHPDESRSLLQRRSRKPLELGFFVSEADRQDSTQLARAASGKRLQNSASMPSMAQGPKSPGSLRSPPPFPPPSMPLPAIPNGQHVPSPKLLQPNRPPRPDHDMPYGKHSPICSAVDLLKQEHGRSRSSSLDTPSAMAGSRAHPQPHPAVEGRRGFDLSTSCTFTPIANFNHTPSRPRYGTDATLPERAPQIELSFLAQGPSAHAHSSSAAGIELGTLGKLRNDFSNYGRTSLDYASPRMASAPNTLSRNARPDVSPDPRTEQSPARARIPVSPPSSPPAAVTSLSRSDSRGRRSSISYKHEPSWSIANQTSPPQAVRELQHSERPAPSHTSSSSLRHMAAFISSGTSVRPAQGTGHVAKSSGGSTSSRETSPLIPMLQSSSQAGSSASSASFDGPNTPAESISERFQTADAALASRRSNSVPRILFLASQEVPTGYEHLLRGRMDAMGLATAQGKPAAVAAPHAASALNELPPHAQVSPTVVHVTPALQSAAAAAAAAEEALSVARSPNNLSPIPGSGPGSYEAHSNSAVLAMGLQSTRSSGVFAHSTGHQFLPIGHLANVERHIQQQQQQQQRGLVQTKQSPLLTPLQQGTFAGPSAARGLSHGRFSQGSQLAPERASYASSADAPASSHPPSFSSYTIAPTATLSAGAVGGAALISPASGAALAQRADSGLGWNHGFTPSRKSSVTSSRAMSGSFRRDDDVEYGMAM